MSVVGQDSSMEDILASIKRVIAEDVRPVAQRGARPRADVDEGDEDDVLELDTPIVPAPVMHTPVIQTGAAADPSLVSQDAAEAARSSLAALSALRPPGAVPASGDGAIEAVVRDMLRPMLKDWLDQNLPGIVTDIVAREVSRITGKG